VKGWSFKRGLIVGMGIGVLVFLGITAFRFFYNRDRKAIEYMGAK
jgi:hypothetical protein